jgi:hypothetical protein
MLEIHRLLAIGKPNPDLWDEICVITDLNIQAARGAIQGCGHAVSLAVVGREPCGSTCPVCRTKRNLDAPVVPKELCVPAITSMCQKCKLQKMEGKAFNFWLPRRPGNLGTLATRLPLQEPRLPSRERAICWHQ